MPQLPQKARINKDLAAEASPWLDEYIEFSKKWSPRAFNGFHEACGLWILSTVAGRRLKVELGGAKHGNLYILIAAKSGTFAKTTTAGIATQVIGDTNLKWALAPDEATPQALIKHLSGQVPQNYHDMSEERQEWTKRRLAMRGARGWHYEEFGGKVNQIMREGGFMADFRNLLRKFYDCPEEYEYVTIGRGTDHVERPYLALLGSITPADMQVSGKRGAAMWRDGFWARFAFVCPPKDASTGFGRWPEGVERVVPGNVQKQLSDWNHRLPLDEVTILGEEGDSLYAQFGEVPQTVLTLGEGVFNAFYNYHDSLEAFAAEDEDADLGSSFTRGAQTALSISMLLTSLENGTEIEMKYWARAQEITERWRQGLYNLYDQINETETEDAKREEAIYRHLGAKGVMTAREIGLYLHISTPEAAFMLDRLAEAGELERKESESGRTFHYSLSK